MDNPMPPANKTTLVDSLLRAQVSMLAPPRYWTYCTSLTFIDIAVLLSDLNGVKQRRRWGTAVTPRFRIGLKWLRLQSWMASKGVAGCCALVPEAAAVDLTQIPEQWICRFQSGHSDARISIVMLFPISCDVWH